MKTQKMFLVFLLLASSVLTAMGCAEEKPTAAPTPTLDINATVAASVAATQAAAPTLTAAATPAPTPTATPAPTPTATPAPTPTATPMPAPTFVPAGPMYSSYNLAATVERVTPGIVRIETDLASGTGIIYETTSRDSALVITNYHVVEGANRIDILVEDLEWHQAKVLAYTDSEDIALLEICCGDFQPVTFRRDYGFSVKPGTEVIAIGYPLGIPGPPTVTRGIVSAKRDVRWVEMQSRDGGGSSYGRTWLIQTDAPLNPGNSGGPLMLRTGEVVGVNTYKYIDDGAGGSAEGLGFAVGEDTIHWLMDVWKNDLNLPTAPSSESLQWRTYFNVAYDYSVSIPAGWEIHERTHPTIISASSPDTSFFVTIFVPDGVIESAKERLQGNLDLNKQLSYAKFEILQQHSSLEANGDQIGYTHYLYKISQESCLEHERAYLVVTRSRSYWLRARICEDSLDQYPGVIDHFFNSLTLWR